MTTSCARLLLFCSLACLLAGSALGVRTRTWHLDQPADLLAGTLDDIALTNQAELLLASQIQRYPLDPKEADTVNALAVGPGGAVYIGTGPNGIIYRIIDNAIQRVADLAEGQVFSLLLLPDRTLLAGVGGTQGLIYRIEPSGQTSVFWQAPGVRYVWSLARDEQGDIYAGTGASGEIYKFSPDGRNATKLAALGNTRNVLSVAPAGASRLVFGTDGSGLIGSINTRTGRLRILFDTGDRSISSIVPQPDGTVYVTATRSGVEKAPAGTPPARPQGRPDANASRPGPADGNGIDPVTATTELIGTATSPARDRQQSAQNMIYRIDPNGLTTEVLALPAMLLGMTSAGEDLLVSTGAPGRIYRIEPAGERYVSLVREDSSYFSAVARADRSHWVGSSRPAAIVRVQPDYTSEGVFTSAPLDAGLLSLWGQVRIDASIPPNTSVALQTRSGNTRDMAGPGWSDWSRPIDIRRNDTSPIQSPPGRFLQIRLQLKSDTGENSPLIRSVDIPYMTMNLPPEISAVSTQTTSAVSKRPASTEEWYASDSTITIEWQARDPNGDALSYDLYVRPVGTDRWTRIASEQTKTSYTWDSRGQADGSYELRLVATDALENTPAAAFSRTRRTEPFFVDNTAPHIENLQVRSMANRMLHVQAQLVDKGTHVIAAQYQADSSDKWIMLLPVDGIFDSRTERLDFEVGPLSRGEHVLTVRTADARGNVSYAWQAVTVE